MPPRPALADDIIVHHARLAGRAAGRGVLERAMAGVHSRDVTDSDEILVIPHFRSQVPLSSARPPAYFAHQLSAQLLNLRRDALVDPSGFSGPARVLRFTSQAAFAFWVLAGWLRGGEAAVAVSKALEGGSVQEWQRKHVLGDARVLVKLIGLLARSGLAVRWAKQLTARDIALATPQLEQAYRVPVKIWEADQEKPFDAMAPNALSPKLNKRRFDTTPSARERARRPAPQLPAFPIAPIIAAAVQAGNDLASLEEPARRFLAVTLALSAAPNIGSQLVRIDWIGAFQPLQMAHRPTGTPSGMTEAGQRASTVNVMTATSDTLLRRGAPHVAGRVSRNVWQGNPVVMAERKLRSEADAAPETAQIVSRRATPADRAINPEADISFEFSTRFGGIFFLVNVFTALGLYPDFTRPLYKGLDVSPFWLLDRLALTMFGSRYGLDPLHNWLGTVGRGGTLPDHWAVEPEWLEGIGRPMRVSRHQCRNRLTYWDARGFALLDLPGRHALWPGTTKAWKRQARLGCPVPGSLRRLPSRAAERWISCMAAFLEFRLGIAATGLSSALLQMQAQVRVREDAVSVQFALASLPMSIRIAGLDRNPGWLPTEGRDLMFEFA